MVTEQERRGIAGTMDLLALGALVELLLAREIRDTPDPLQTADEYKRLAKAIADSSRFDAMGPEHAAVAAEEFRRALYEHVDRSRAMADVADCRATRNNKTP